MLANVEDGVPTLEKTLVQCLVSAESFVVYMGCIYTRWANVGIILANIKPTLG